MMAEVPIDLNAHLRREPNESYTIIVEISGIPIIDVANHVSQWLRAAVRDNAHMPANSIQIRVGIDQREPLQARATAASARWRFDAVSDAAARHPGRRRATDPHGQQR